MDLADPNIMTNIAQLTNVAPGIRAALLGGQQQQQNDNLLAQQQMQLDAAKRADAARVAASQIVSNPKIDDAQFETLLKPIAEADPNAAVAMRRQRTMLSQQAQLAADPNPVGIARFGMMYPEAVDPIKKAWDMLGSAQKDAALKTSADVYGLLSSGDSTGAVDLLKQHMDATAKTGEDVSSYPRLIQLIQADPKKALYLAATNLSAAMGADKFGEVYGKVNPNAVATDAAKAAQEQTSAQFAAPKAQSDLETAKAQRDRWVVQNTTDMLNARTSQGRLDLDKDRLVTETQLKLDELAQNGVKRDEGSTKIMNDSASSAVEANALADRERDLAARVRQAGLTSGPRATAAEALKRATGSQDTYTQLRAEWTQLKNNQALANRKNMPGAMSDADREFLLKGFPPDNASPEYISHFLETMAHAQTIVGQQEDRKASWISANGNLGSAKSDINVGGTTVPAGTTFAEFMTNAAKRGNRGNLPSGVGALLQKYGGSK